MKKEINQIPEMLDEKRLKAVFESKFLQKKLEDAKKAHITHNKKLPTWS